MIMNTNNCFFPLYGSCIEKIEFYLSLPNNGCILNALKIFNLDIGYGYLNFLLLWNLGFTVCCPNNIDKVMFFGNQIKKQSKSEMH